MFLPMFTIKPTKGLGLYILFQRNQRQDAPHALHLVSTHVPKISIFISEQHTSVAYGKFVSIRCSVNKKTIKFNTKF